MKIRHSFLSCFLSLCLPTLTVSAILGRTRRETPNQRYIMIRNMGGRRVDVFWMNTNEDPVELVSQSENAEGYAYGSDTSLLSYIGHSFQVQEMPGKKSGKCLYDKCRTLEFTVTDGEGQEVYINPDFELEFTDVTQRAEKKAQQLLDKCHQSISLEENGDDPLQAVDALTECMSQQMNETLALEEEERTFQSNLRKSMANQITSYACGDPDFESSIEILNRTWHYEIAPGEYKDFLMQTHHERPTSRILVIPDFASSQECQALDRAKVTSRSSNHAKDQIPFTIVNGKSKESMVVHACASKMYELARITLSWQTLDFQDQYNLGQELFDIHIDTEGADVPTELCTKKEEEEDQAAASSVSIEGDGQVVADADAGKSCRLPGAPPLEVSTKKLEASRNKLATIFVFCNKPNALGGIHFPHAGVHINPEEGMAVVAVHRYLESPEYDGFVQEYHLCPNHHVYSHSFWTKP